MAQVVEYLPSKHKALNSNPSTAKKVNFSHGPGRIIEVIIGPY
jgi:hypothetical protein